MGRIIKKLNMMLSIVSPIYKAENIVEKLVSEIEKEVSKLNITYEIILVDDRSPDGSWEKMKEIASQYNNIKIIKELVVESGLRSAGGYEAMKAILSLSPSKWPTAVCAVADPAAFGAMNAIKEAGLRVPEDISVVGFSDDIRAQLVNPPLTTIRQPAYEVGLRAAQKLISHIENKGESEEEIVIKTELVLRQSCQELIK